MSGIVFDIKRFAVHDGPGIRSTVFLKGCPLQCHWCQNPEGIGNEIQLWYFEHKCVRCHGCIEACPVGALSTNDTAGLAHIVVDHEACTLCGDCVAICPAQALAFDAREMSEDEVIDEILKDRVFYDTSGGGVTLSGGDPLLQEAFSLALLELCRKNNIHTAVETCLFANEEIIKRFLDVTDLFLIDLKLSDPDQHRKHTGRSNDSIKTNFGALAAAGANIIVRLPLIPGITATQENIRDIARYVKRVRADIPLQLINFNPLARDKYRRMRRPYEFENMDNALSEQELDIYTKIITTEGVRYFEG